MNWLDTNAADQLRWYFTQAASACGIRSVQSGFEATMERLALCGRAGEGQIHIHETRSSNADDGVTDGRLGAYEKARAIYNRLAVLPAPTRDVLELQYGCAHMLGDISLSLACAMPGAIAGHMKATAASHARAERRRVDEARRTAMGRRERGKSSPKPKARSVSNSGTVRDFVVFLCATEEGRTTLGTIIEEARGVLRSALDAYSEAGECAT